MTESSKFCIIRLAALCKKLQVSKATVYSWMDIRARSHNPDFPLPVRLGKATVGWLESEVDAFLLKRMAERDTARSA